MTFISGRLGNQSENRPLIDLGVKNPDGSVCYIIGVTKAIRTALGKHDGDTIRVVIELRE